MDTQKLPELEEIHDQSANPQPPKKQVRRRLHASRPYQERLINMAEARREIVTALQIHRASMMIRKSKVTPSLPSLEESPPHDIDDDQTSCRVHPHNCSFHQYLKVPLIRPPLGLNLNLEGFSSIQQASFCSRIRTAPQTEWSSSNNHSVDMAASSAMWSSSILKNMEDSTGQYGGDLLELDQIFDIPSWINCDEQRYDARYYAEDYRKDASLPCLDIEEIQGWEWLSQGD